MNLASGAYNDVVARPPIGVTLLLLGDGKTSTIVGHSPAFTLVSGTAIIQGLTLTTATDSPTILVSGGQLSLSDDTVQESTGSGDSALLVTGGTLDLGSVDHPSGNVLDVNGGGEFVHDDAAVAISTVGTTFEVDGWPITATSLSTTALAAPAGPFILGQAVSFTATVRASLPGLPSPTGSVRFVFDGVVQAPVSLQLVAGLGIARFATPMLGVGSHIITAYYEGDAAFTSSLSAARVSVVTVGDGPRLISVRRASVRGRSTSLVLTFDRSLDPSRAQNPSNYQIVMVGGRNKVGAELAVRTAIYDPTLASVTLVPKRALNFQRTYRLTVVGTGAGGVTDRIGRLLDGEVLESPGRISWG